VKTPRSYTQGYNAQAVVNEDQIVLAATVRTISCGLYLAVRQESDCPCGGLTSPKINEGDLMARIIVTTEPSEQHDSRAKGAGAFGTHPLTERQVRRIRRLPDGHRVVSVRDGMPIVRQPGGKMLRMQPSGRLVVTVGVERVQSYLHVHG